MKTFIPEINVKDRSWLLFDANGKTLGRLAVRIANALRGKNKPIFAPQIDAGDFVVVINAEKVVLTGKKEDQKIYQRYSGFRSGQQRIPAHVIRERHPDRLIVQAVKRMLPKNNTARKIMTRLKIYAGDKHPHVAQKPRQVV
ncbi:MAG: 50S ribosomal protein L13 [Kiritimatiellae bacterium]|nr:50S ribosomal protein L13 [Kiritimatiellia bacterium]MDD5521273.1 50S ribosomal protein L13 [Kiritimatiellia bacterium]